MLSTFELIAQNDSTYAANSRAPVLLRPILFEYHSCELLSDTINKNLVEALYWLRRHPELKIEVGCHSDPVPPSTSTRYTGCRAKSVYQYFVNNGIDPKRLSHKGYGSSKPIAPNDTEEGRAKNRRVELLVVK